MQNKRILAILTGLFLIVTTIYPIGVSLNSTSDESTLSITYNFDLPEIKTIDGITKVSIDNCILRHILGEPLIPIYSAKILLPQGKDVDHVVLNYGKPILLELDLTLEHSQNPTIIGKTPVYIGPNPDIYESDEPYPKTLYDVTGTYGLNGFDILNINLYPVRYIPNAGKILYFPAMTIKVFLKDGDVNPLFRQDIADTNRVKNIVDNPQIISTYEDTSFEQGFLSTADYDYVIITSSSLVNVFQPLLDHKNLYTTTNIVDTTYINGNYLGDDLQEKIRNFITDAYLNWGTTYVLLGGDVDIIPYRGMYGYVSTSPVTIDIDIPVDMYYGALDGNWNYDGDSYWGEYSDYPDYYAEVFIGRAPVSTESQVSNFINKVIGFETSVKPTKVQLHQSRLRNSNIPDSRTISEECEQWIPPSYTVDKLYEEDGPVTKTDWINSFDWGPLIIQHTGHGSYTFYGLNYENGGNVYWYNSDALSLTNNFYPIQSSLACLSGAFDANDCLAEAYMLAENGGTSACMFNSREGWFYLNYAAEPTGAFIEQQFWEIFQNGTEPLGKVMQFAKEDLVGYVTPNTGDASCWRWCYYEINLLGDPESPVLTQRGGNLPPTCTITAYPNSDDAPLTTTFTMTASDPDGSIDHWELDVDNDGIYESTGPGIPPTQTHTYTNPGIYTAELTVWDDDGATATDTTIITVTEPNQPPNTPTYPYPSDGAQNVELNPILSVYVSDPNEDLLDITFYNESNVFIGTDTNVPSGDYASVEWSNLNPDKTYGWYAKADDNRGGITSSGTWYFKTTDIPSPKKYHADGETIVTSGGLSGSFLNTHYSNNIYEGITEKKTGPRSQLEHIWTITIPSGFENYKFYIEAYHTSNTEGDDFVFAYSTDNIIYHDMVTVTKTVDDNTFQTFNIPNTVGGIIYIRVLDLDQTKGNNCIDTIYIDEVYIEVGGNPPLNIPPDMPTNPTPADGASNINLNPTLSVYVNDQNFDVLTVTFFDDSNNPIGTDTVTGSGIASTNWIDVDQYQTTYYWYVIIDDSKATTTSDIWNFETRNEAPPNDMFISDISWSFRTAGKNIFLSHIITVISSEGPVSGATVYSSLTNNGTGEIDTFSGLTDASGQVVFEQKCKPGEYEAFVTDIAHLVYDYNPAFDLDNPSSYTLS